MKTEDYNSSPPYPIPPLGDYCKPSFNSFFCFRSSHCVLPYSVLHLEQAALAILLQYCFFAYVAQFMREAEPVGVVHIVLFITFYLK